MPDEVVPVSEGVAGTTVEDSIPGLYPGLSRNKYDAWKAINHSRLYLFERSAMHAQHSMLYGRPETPALFVGHAFHVAVLEPERFEVEYASMPDFGDGRTAPAKKRRSDWMATHAGKRALEHQEHAALVGMARAIHAHPLAHELCTAPGLNELSALWKDEKTGLTAKCRVDRFTSVFGYSTIVDLKSSRDASWKMFRKDIEKFNYASQGAFYLQGFDALSPMPRKYVFVVVESEAPHGVAVYELDETSILEGRKRCRRWLDMYSEATKTGVWAGYPENLQQISLPPWAITPGEIE